MTKRSELLDMLKSDPLGLLVNTDTKKKLQGEDYKLVSMFEEIQDFVDEYKREPESNTSNIIEFKLYARLRAIRSDPRKVKALKKYDFGNLFAAPEVKEVTLEDIIADDPYGLISTDADEDIFKLRHVKPSERINPDYLSRRKICKDFHLYKDMFNVFHEELASKKRRLVAYNSADLKPGHFYALGGILVYLKSVSGDVSQYGYKSGDRERFDGRTVCIFDNGTESDMLFRSLDKAMQLDGYSISEVSEVVAAEEVADESDVLNGYIYVLKTRNSRMQSMDNLYKIGFTSGSVARRIINARKEATYLFSEVDIVATYRCLNMTTYDLEQMIHGFFSSVRLNVELLDSNGSVYRPREWFVVDIKVIEEAIRLIMANTINEYEYDARIDQIVRKIASKS